MSKSTYKTNIDDKMLRGWMSEIEALIRLKSQKNDRFIAFDLTSYLFCNRDNGQWPNAGCQAGEGDDLAARNIQRGRDHGIPSYSDLRAHCDLQPLTNWDNPPSDIEKEDWQSLRNVYPQVLCDLESYFTDVFFILVDI